MLLKERTGCVIVGPSADDAPIPGIDLQVRESENLKFGNNEAHVYDTPGHTSGHIVYHFVMGCGRLFEGSPEKMWSLL